MQGSSWSRGNEWLYGMENIIDLQKLLFDKPVPFIKMFDAKTRTSLMRMINEIRENAVNITA